MLIEGRDLSSVAEFAVSEGEQRSFSLSWFPALEAPPLPLDAMASLRRTENWWRNWVARCTYEGEWRDDVIRSLITLKALHLRAHRARSCAAATTSLPEWIGSVRNWDYRYSWLRDSSFTLQALLLSGYTEEAMAWYQWLRRAVAGSPGDFQIMYGVRGERRLTEIELDWLPGYEGSTAGAHRQPGQRAVPARRVRRGAGRGLDRRVQRRVPGPDGARAPATAWPATWWPR